MGAPDRNDPNDPDGPGPKRGENKVDLRRATEVTRPRTIGGLVYLGVLTGALIGVVVASLGPWRVGVSVMAVSMMVAAGARLLIPENNSGMLKIRNRYLDAILLIAVGVAILVLVATIPDQVN